MFGFPTQWRYIKAPLCFFGLIFLLEFLKPTSSQVLGFLPKQIAEGEIWRVITGQILHTNFNHVVLNVAGLALVWALHGEYYTARHYTLVLTISLILVGIGLALTYSDTIYSGLSGIIHTLLIYGAVIDVSKHKKTGWLLIIGVWAKVYYELSFGASVATANLIEARVAVEAHLIGVCVGSILGPLYLIINRKKALC